MEENKMANAPKEGDLKVWWIPQVGQVYPAFERPVANVREAALLLDVLANYDLYQLENRIKPDFANAGGLAVFEDGLWVDWQCPETFEEDPVQWVKDNPASLLEEPDPEPAA